MRVSTYLTKFEPKISIITVCYNSSKTIVDTLNSIKNQTYKNIEHILIDGDSTDETLELLSTNLVPNSIILSEPDEGLYDAINKGLKLSSGDIIGLLHSDDLFASETVLEKVKDAFANRDIGCVYGNLIYFKNDFDKKVQRIWKSEKFRSQLLKDGWMPPHPTVFLRNDVISRVGFYNLNYKVSADYDFVIRLFSTPNLKSLFIDFPITFMRMGGASGNAPKNFYRKVWKISKLFAVIKSEVLGAF